MFGTSQSYAPDIDGMPVEPTEAVETEPLLIKYLLLMSLYLKDII